MQDTYSGGAPLLLQSVENIAVSAAVNLASNRIANVSQDGSMEAVFKSEHLGKEWLAGRALDDHLFSPHTQTQTNAHTILHTHTHTRAHTHTHTSTHKC